MRTSKTSKDRLAKVTSKKFDTTMIGALDAIEKGFGFLWKHEDDVELSAQEENMLSIYNAIRQRILDLGNKQKRDFLNEVARYDVKFNQYRMEFVRDSQSGLLVRKN